MSLAGELKVIEGNDTLLQTYADKHCHNRCYGRGYISWVVGKDPLTGEILTRRETCKCVIKALKKDMKSNG